jgi:hypothetical protein
MPKDQKPHYMRWHPETGEPAIYHSEADIPAGHLDHHPADPNHAKPAPVKPEKPAKVDPEYGGMTRKEIRAALNDGGVAYDKSADTEELLKVLDDKVRAVLTEQGREFDPNASTKALLGLLSPAE